MELNAYNEMQKIWSTITKEENVKDHSFDLMAFKSLLDIFHVGQYYYFIVNVRKVEYEMFSPEVETVLGYSPEEITVPFITAKMHPEDLPHYLNFEVAITNFFSKISGERLFKYKVQHDFRVQKANGEYIRVLNQFVIIQHDADNVRTFVVNTDITHLKKDPKPVLSFIGLDGEPSYMNVDVENVFNKTRELFTKRELDVVRLLAKGKSSGEISDTLNISKYTVDSHRKNILKKTDAKSTNEVIGIAFNNGWI